MYRFFKLKISNKSLSEVMYAILITRSKLINSFGIGLYSYTRKQNSGNYIDVVIEIEEKSVKKFEELTGLKLKTSEEFQGKMQVN